MTKADLIEDVAGAVEMSRGTRSYGDDLRKHRQIAAGW
jgi:hypothetical protein